MKIIGGDSVAEEALFRRYQRAISVILWKSGKDRLTADDINDLCHDTFIITVEKIRNREIREPERLPGFIRSVALHLCAAHLRKLGWYDQESDELVDQPEKRLNQFEELVKKEETRIIREVLAQLKPERDRVVLSRYFIEEEARETICTNLGLSKLQFNVILCRALERYKVLYQRILARMNDQAASSQRLAKSKL